MKINLYFKRLTKRHFFKLLIWIAAVLGITWQLDIVFETYFNYQTVTDTVIKMPAHLEVPSITICTGYADILDWDKLLELKNVDKSKFDRRDFVHSISGNLTIKEIFDLTPVAEDFYDHCFIRRKSTRRFSCCACQDFQYDKFFTQDFMCYKVRPPQINLAFTSYAEAFENPGLIYGIGLNANISQKIHRVLPIISSNELVTTPPADSKMYSNIYHCSVDNNASVTIDEFKIKYDRASYNNLGFPYDTFFCAQTLEESMCLGNCLVETSKKKLGKLMTELEIRHPYNYTHVSWEEMEDPRIASMMDQIIENCDQNVCNIINCHDNYTRTSYKTKPSTRHGHWFSIGTPNSPYVHVAFVPKVNIMDLVVYIVSFTGAWFGFAFVDIGSLKFRNIFLDKSPGSELNHLPSYRNRKILDPRIANLHMQHYASLFRPPR